MKITSSKPKGHRIFKCNTINTIVGKTIRPFWVEPVESGFWFNPQTLEWIKNPESYAGLTTSYYSMEYL